MPRITPSEAVRAIDRDFRQFVNHPLNPGISGADKGPNLAGLVELLEGIPQELLLMPPSVRADFTQARAALKSVANQAASDPISSFGCPMLGDHNAISIVHTALLQCPDEAPFSESSILKFVDDAELRGSLLIDLHAVQVNLHEGSWKPATVLAGSVIEALLLWAITRLPEILKTRAEALSWEGLGTLGPLALEKKLITKDVATSVELAQNFRNLIHPGRELRTGTKCDQGSAYGAASAMHLVIRDLDHRTQNAQE